MSKTFCPIPWLHQAVRTNGDCRICCQANVTPNQGILRKANGDPYNVSRDNIFDIQNADLLKRVRLNMINGDWNPECGRCKSEEETGMMARRPSEVERWEESFTFADAVNATKPDGSIDLKPIYLDLRFGNFCNLKCRMCGPTESHSWYEEHVDYFSEQGFNDTQGFVKLVRNDKGRWISNEYNWHGNEYFWNNLEENMPNLRRVYMAGGEPLLIERHYEFLQQCIDLGHSKNIVLEYNTNLSVLPDRVLSMWTYFKMVRIGASIDGMEDILEYQRYPFKWNTALKNLKILDDVAVKNDNIFPSMKYTVSAYNVFHLPKFMWWKLFDSGFKKINDVDHKPVIGYHMVYEPYRVCTQMFPTDIKQKLKSHYSEWEEKFNNSDLQDNIKETAIDILQSVITFTFLEDRSNELPEFVKFTKYLDQKRTQDIMTVIPELRSLFE